ncbi:MAG: multiheme c-type cytochrome, partial [Phycisphaerae bacterium]
MQRSPPNPSLSMRPIFALLRADAWLRLPIGRGLWTGALLLLACAGCDRARQEEGPAAATNQPDVRRQQARYAGSATCRACHERQYQEWRTSNHALAERMPDPALDEPAFAARGTIRHGSVTSDARRRGGGGYELVTQGRDGLVRPFAIERVLGHSPLRQYLVEAAGGRYQVTELAYDPHRSEWFDVFGEEDRKPHEWGHWTNRGMTWNSMCADCHNTNLHKNYDAATDSYHTTKAEMGVGCEACHGPSAAHVDWQRKSAADVARQRDDPMLSDYRRLNQPALLVDACGSCHSRRSELREAFTPGEPFLDSFMPALPDHDETWYADGQVHEEDYVYASFLMSRMYAEGVTCLDCHRPHGLGLLSSGNELCLRCHAGKIDPAAHSLHDPGGAGGQCVNCHMPHTTYMRRHPRRDHGFTIPDPQLTREFGIPNACNRCHADKRVDWAVEAVERWYGERMERRTRTRARLVARARERKEGVEGELIRFVAGEALPMWRAIGAGLLREWVGSPDVDAALVAHLADESPLVRLSAARALEAA